MKRLWKSRETAWEWGVQCEKEQKGKPGKGEGVPCTGFGVCLTHVREQVLKSTKGAASADATIILCSKELSELPTGVKVSKAPVETEKIRKAIRAQER